MTKKFLLADKVTFLNQISAGCSLFLFTHSFIPLVFLLLLVCYDDLIKQMLANESELGQSMKPYAERGVRSMLYFLISNFHL